MNRAEVSAKLWQLAEHRIIAEWICCEPLDPAHHLCAKGYAALDMAKALLVDGDPAEAWNPQAPVLDAVMKLLDDRAHAEAERLRQRASLAELGVGPFAEGQRQLILQLADLVDPYEMRDGQLVRTSDGKPVVP